MIEIMMTEALALHGGAAWTKDESRWEIEARPAASGATSYAEWIRSTGEPFDAAKADRHATEVCYPASHCCGCACERCGSADRILVIWTDAEGFDCFVCVSCLAVDESNERLVRKEGTTPLASLPGWL